VLPNPPQSDGDSDDDSSSGDTSIDEESEQEESHLDEPRARSVSPPVNRPPAVDEVDLRERMSAMGLDHAPTPHSADQIIGLIARNTTRMVNRMNDTHMDGSMREVADYAAVEVNCNAVELYKHVRDRLPIQDEYNLPDGDVSQTTWCRPFDDVLIPMETNNLRNMLREDRDVSSQVGCILGIFVLKFGQLYDESKLCLIVGD